MEKEKVLISSQEVFKEVPYGDWVLHGFWYKAVYVIGWAVTLVWVTLFLIGFLQGLTGVK